MSTINSTIPLSETGNTRYVYISNHIVPTNFQLVVSSDIKIIGQDTEIKLEGNAMLKVID